MTSSLPTATRYVWECTLCKAWGKLATHSQAPVERTIAAVRESHARKAPGCHSANVDSGVTYRPEKEDQ